ncbi:hypothetical protein B0I35DRAFT_358609 [Stachybotrys elegans]|uniref:NAD-dependent epimerase/dehydratase domain-containing protein n=1 Tax=Stachybotrys elegans TaxID=80388 RepID=A0A8K0SN54_9HYPO|nr:hypothetical protein B0I35DRAFT_358609 [Stachybotrys elegans]
MHVFITGATGFIGQAIITELLRAGHTVLGLARSDKAAEALVASGATALHGSLDDLESLRRGAAASDGVVHLAFKHDFANYADCCRADRDAITAMADVLAGSNRPLLITTGTMLLPFGQLGVETDLHDTSFPFAERGQSEVLARDLASQGVRTAIMRLAVATHGPNDEHMFLSKLISAARAAGTSAYVGSGRNRWPATHLVDTAVAYRLALETTAPGQTYHVVAEEGVTMRDIAETIGKKLGVPAVSMSTEEAAERFGFFAAFVAADNPASSARTQEVLGWAPGERSLLADLEEGTYFPC